MRIDGLLFKKHARVFFTPGRNLPSSACAGLGAEISRATPDTGVDEDTHSMAEGGCEVHLGPLPDLYIRYAVAIVMLGENRIKNSFALEETRVLLFSQSFVPTHHGRSAPLCSIVRSVSKLRFAVTNSVGMFFFSKKKRAINLQIAVNTLS